jgi:predicted RNA-binding Zn-ribbon protein involved in translation (DUF1610 family)
MDISTITTALSSLKIAKDAFTFLLDTKIEADARSKVIEALQGLDEAQDQLFQLRGELFRLQTENKELKDALFEKNEWKQKILNYELVETSGGAVVYKSKAGTQHYACPSCIERNEIHILQDRRVMSGDFDCPGCVMQWGSGHAKYLI